MDNVHERSNALIRKATFPLDYANLICLYVPSSYARGERVRAFRCQRSSRRICYPQEEFSGRATPPRSDEERQTVWVTSTFGTLNGTSRSHHELHSTVSMMLNRPSARSLLERSNTLELSASKISAGSPRSEDVSFRRT